MSEAGRVRTLYEDEKRCTVSVTQPDGSKRYYVYERHGNAWYEAGEVEKLRAKVVGR